MTKVIEHSWLLENKHALIVKGPSAAASLMGIPLATLKTRLQSGSAFSETGKVANFSPVMILANYITHWGKVMGHEESDALDTANSNFDRYLTSRAFLMVSKEIGFTETTDPDLSRIGQPMLLVPVSRMLNEMCFALHKEYHGS